MIKIALGIEYNGSEFHGWQYQHNCASVQQAVEQALHQMAGSKVNVTASGRTDAGVHAMAQVVHFQTDTVRTMHAWIMGTNSYLPHSIRVLWALEVPNDFNARYSALERSYKYIIYNNKVRPALLFNRVSWYHRALNAEHMQHAVDYWLGEHDFSSFRAAGCQSKSPIRNITSIKITKIKNFIVMDVTANAFLHHMIRNMVGVLLPIGYGNMPVSWAKEVLDAKNRSAAGVTALPYGLYLSKVVYPDRYKIPSKDPKMVII